MSSPGLSTTALAYAAHGWPVFVLSRTKKPVRNCPRCHPASEEYELHDPEPCECLTCHGFYAATRDPERIKAMLDRHPHGCLAIRTGAPSGLVVVDVDVDGSGKLSDPGLVTLAKLDEARLLPGTVMQMTGSGGLHLLYAHPGGYIQSGASKLGPSVDVKADGAYIVAAPSVHPGTGYRYQWTGDGTFDHPLPPLHAALTVRLRPPVPKPRPVGILRPATPRGRLSGLLQAILDAPGPPSGKRNDVLWWASKKAVELVDNGEMPQADVVAALQRTAITAGLTVSETGDETHGTIHSGFRSGRRAVGA